MSHICPNCNYEVECDIRKGRDELAKRRKQAALDSFKAWVENATFDQLNVTFEKPTLLVKNKVMSRYYFNKFESKWIEIIKKKMLRLTKIKM